MSILAIVLALFLTAILIGMRLPKTHAAASRIRLPVPPERVFAVITDFEAYPLWRPGLDRVESGPELDGLPSWYEFCTRDLRVQFRVTAWQPPHHLRTRLVADELPLSGAWDYDLAREDCGGTVLTITGRDKIHHPLLRFFTRYFLSYHGAMDIYLIALARHFGIAAVPEHLSLKPADDALAD
ncbi:SRPBCC family protein [Methylococcus sp. EFPC2]|uniref:SRPBCC family protein n=1 Tax=Methylococcus sp. EFPC2 TaxID=2812648 RepID=UPI0019683F53|nr:SRPBCC family protein [Methylococcus sp. EFPC2]QSA98797.1 SRPBCC family protein [Methylococcus sp. EFPC2]